MVVIMMKVIIKVIEIITDSNNFNNDNSNNEHYITIPKSTSNVIKIANLGFCNIEQCRQFCSLSRREVFLFLKLLL